MGLPNKIPGLRKYPLDIVEGGLYEAWLRDTWEGPRPVIAIRKVKMPTYVCWEILVDDEIHTVHAACVFLTGTATPPTDAMKAAEIIAVQPMTAPTKINLQWVR
jgi:hypothetical protein